MKKVDIVYSGWLEAPNGASKFLSGLKCSADSFSDLNVDMNIISKGDYKAWSTNYNFGKVKSKETLRTRIFSMAKRTTVGSLLLLYILYLKNHVYIVNKYKKENRVVDIVYFHEFFTCYAYLRRKKKGKEAILLSLHSSGDIWGMFFETFPLLNVVWLRPLFRYLERYTFSRIDRVGFVADYPRKKFGELYPEFPFDKTFFVYNGLETKPFIKKDRDIKSSIIQLVCVGTLCDRKNQMGILQALASLPNDLQKRYSLTLVGDGNVRNELENFSRKNIHTEVKFVGSVADVTSYLLTADVFILLSKDEGLPISILEAMRCSLPIISTQVAGIPEMIEDGKSGYLIPPDYQKLSLLLLDLLEKNVDLIGMGERSKSLFEQKFTKEKMILAYSKLFHSI